MRLLCHHMCVIWTKIHFICQIYRFLLRLSEMEVLLYFTIVYWTIGLLYIGLLDYWTIVYCNRGREGCAVSGVSPRTGLWAEKYDSIYDWTVRGVFPEEETNEEI